MMNIILRLFVLAAFLFCQHAYAVNDQSAKVKWGYIGSKGPSRWGELNPSFALCSLGKMQSPINITKNFKIAPNTLEINYTSAPLTILDDGLTELTIGNEQTIVNEGHSIQVNFHDGVTETISLDNKKYHLVQFHIHTPSENQQQGRAYPLEIHFVHQGEGGEVVVMGVFAKGGPANPELQKIIHHIPLANGNEQTFANEQINPANLLPEKQDHFQFAGSLTTPPCTEGLTWVVMANPITVSPAQIFELRREMGGENARPVQRLNGRQIHFSATKE